MNTQSHAILTFFLLRAPLGRRIAELRQVNVAIFSGALVPDLPIFAFFAWYTLIDPTPQRIIWKEFYFDSTWQALFSPFHSLPLWGALAAACWVAKRPRGTLFGAAAFLAAAQDLLLHNDDAHPHFWPLSDYRFASPVSYWDPAHYGFIASALELTLVLGASLWSWRRLETRWGRALLVLAVASLTLTHGLWSVLFRFL